MGRIALSGIAVLNGLVMVTSIQALMANGMQRSKAAYEGAMMRLRPVVMTALAAFFAMIPAALAIERGSEANAPLARAILGGLMAGGPGTLFVLPCLYALMVRDKPEADDNQAPEGDHRVAAGDA